MFAARKRTDRLAYGRLGGVLSLLASRVLVCVTNDISNQRNSKN